jgi:GTP-binding protein Era
MKYGKVVIVGRPNTGKSTLINAIMQQKVSITSPLPQTTRISKRVVFEDDRGKIVFSDTPGIINKIDDLMGRRVNQEAPKEINKADLLVCLVDISREKSDEENKVIGLIRKIPVKKVLIYNKMDKAIGSKDHLAEYNYLEDEFDEVMTISALKNKNIKGLLKLLFGLLPEKEASVDDAKTENMFWSNPKEYVSEIIREKVYLFLREELPYSVNVEVVEITDKKKMLVIKANIITSVDRYKKMIIGSQGKKIKEIGYNARKELELATTRKIFLELKVVVNRHWMEEFV